MKYLGLRHVLRIHERAIEQTGGDPGVRDINLIESAVAQPRMSFGGQALHPTLPEKAAALAFSLNKNHGFHDGNKRTSFLALEMFLLRNKHEIDATVDECESIFLGVASGSVGRDAFVAWVKATVVHRKT